MIKQNTGTPHQLTERGPRGGCFPPFSPSARQQSFEKAWNAMYDPDEIIERNERASAYLYSVKQRKAYEPFSFVDWIIWAAFGAFFAVLASAFWWVSMEYVAPCGAC